MAADTCRLESHDVSIRHRVREQALDLLVQPSTNPPPTAPSPDTESEGGRRLAQDSTRAAISTGRN